MFSRAKSNLFLCFSQILTTFAIFAKPSLSMACPVVVLRLIERLLRCMKLNRQPRLVRNSYKLCSVASCCAQTVINLQWNMVMFLTLINNFLHQFFFEVSKKWFPPSTRQSSLFALRGRFIADFRRFLSPSTNMLSSIENFLPASLLLSSSAYLTTNCFEFACILHYKNAVQNQAIFTRQSFNKKSNTKLTLYHIIIIFIYHARLLLISFAQIAILCNRKIEPYRFSLHKRSKPVSINFKNLWRRLAEGYNSIHLQCH